MADVFLLKFLRCCMCGRCIEKPLASLRDHLDGLQVKVSASRAEDPGFESCLRRDFSGVESYQ